MLPNDLLLYSFFLFPVPKKKNSFFIRTFFLFVLRVIPYHMYFVRQFPQKKMYRIPFSVLNRNKGGFATVMVIASRIKTLRRPFSHGAIDKRKENARVRVSG